MDRFQPSPMVIDRLPLQRSVVDHTLHDELAPGSGGEQPEELTHLRHLPDPGHLNHVALDRRPDVIAKPPGALTGRKPMHLREPTGAHPLQQLTPAHTTRPVAAQSL